jgi:NADH-quinone oxidoreductase subunit M
VNQVALPLLLALPLAGAVAMLVPAVRPHALRLGTVVSGATVLVAVWAAAAADPVDVTWVQGLDLHFHLGTDGISSPLVLLTAGLSFLCFAYQEREHPETERAAGLVGLLLLLEVGMLGTFVALDLLLFFVFFEVVLVPMWFVIAGWGSDSGRTTRVGAATTFILYTLLGSAVMLLGLLIVRVETGTFDMVVLAHQHGHGISRHLQLLGAVCFVVGFGVKAPMWPLHTWLPDAHTAAPTVGSVLLAGVLLKMGTYGLVRIALPIVPGGMHQVAPWLGGFAVVGIVYGALACLAQTDLKRLIAYSSVGHMGFVLLGIATLTSVGISGALYANLAHGLITGLLFFLVGAVKDRHSTGSIGALGGGLYQRAPRLGGLLAFAAVASLGLPGLAGFWGEMMALLGAFRPGTGLDRGWFLVLMALGGLGIVLTTLYLVTVVRRVDQGVSDPRWFEVPVLDASRAELLVWSPVVAAVLVLGLWPKLVLDVTVPAVRSLVGG